MLHGKDALLNDTTTADKPAVLAAVMVLSAVAGLVLLWSSDKDEFVAQQIGMEISDRDAARVQTILRAF